MTHDAKPIKKADPKDATPLFIGKPDERRCQHCFTGARHTSELHRRTVAYYADDGSN